jgi:Lon protease-like protein
MFPLGSVVFPYTAVPLRVFEPRYLALVERVLADESELGTVLIERGSEVGGGDARTDVGAALRLAGVTDLEDGHRAIVVVGTERIRVRRWLPDDPHPWAEVDEWADEGPASLRDGSGIEAAKAKLAKLLALASELGADTAEVDLDVADDPVAASYQLAAITPVTALDAHRLLRAPGSPERLEILDELLDDQIALVEARLGGG